MVEDGVVGNPSEPAAGEQGQRGETGLEANKDIAGWAQRRAGVRGSRSPISLDLLGPAVVARCPGSAGQV
ncbi:hypothetical protein NDU88_002206 [Pleurodeles waltl]|uniref:Uncharacterized protein n=1 Tax=Pleurodeles waltl TaxID=8319 RepID=A0AAV7SD19_PLEWA|nr:hypothetical protein NDU88_002206 [Pleurodeles waltl]